MKRFVFFSLAGLALLTSCGKSDGDHAATQDTVHRAVHVKAPIHIEPHPGPNGETFTIEYSDRALDSVLKLPAAERPATPEAAAQYHLSMPPKLTVPPHLLPAKDIKLIERTDTTAVFSFAVEHNPLKGLLALRKASNGADTAWVVQMVSSEHPQP
jgi:hypothetical protein